MTHIQKGMQRTDNLVSPGDCKHFILKVEVTPPPTVQTYVQQKQHLRV